jgi:uncharacterized protein (TIGR00730 family)
MSEVNPPAKEQREAEAHGNAAPLAYENSAFLNSSDGRAVRILSEYNEPLARFRRERIQDTVVFFGSARFKALDVARANLQFVMKPGAAQPAPAHEQPAHTQHEADTDELRLKRAEAAVEMARYYEDARQLAHMLTKWAQTLRCRRHRFVVTSGGGPGIMEAANRGAYEAGGKTIGLNIRLPFEQYPNRYITPGLNFEFHYFFMRKLWFAYLAKGLVVFPGGFGTLDEMFEVITLAQTQKLQKPLVIVVYGSEYWKSVVNFETLIEKGVISPDDMKLFRFVDSPQEAFDVLTDGLLHFHVPAWQRPVAAAIDPCEEGTGAEEPEPSAETPEEYFGPELNKTRS